MKKTLKLIPALAMLLVSAILVSTSTYAWFSMNNKVTVTGMTIRTEVNNNLLIAPAVNDSVAATKNGPVATMPAASAYGTHLAQTVEALLEPVSSTTGLYNSFWYTSTTNVVSSGDAKSEAYIAYDAGDTTAMTAFNTNYGTTEKEFVDPAVSPYDGALGYVDYVFALQATNTSTSPNATVDMTKCTLTYKGTDDDGHAFRIAVLVQECTAANTASTTATTKTIIGDASADYFTQSNDATPVNKAVVSASELGNVTSFGEDATIGTVPYGETKYFKVTIRLWLEGEDESCNNATYATLTNKYDLDLKFELNGTAVTEIERVGNTTNAAPAYTVAASATAGSAITLSGITYYPYTSSGTATTIYSNTNSAADTAGKLWYTISVPEVYEITEFVTVNP